MFIIIIIIINITFNPTLNNITISITFIPFKPTYKFNSSIRITNTELDVFRYGGSTLFRGAILPP